jgi:hypothetical protein
MSTTLTADGILTPEAAPAQPFIKTLMRVFRLDKDGNDGPIDLKDLAPEESPEESVKLYQHTYPQLRTPLLSAPFMEGDKWVYEVLKLPVQTKG